MELHGLKAPFSEEKKPFCSAYAVHEGDFPTKMGFDKSTLQLQRYSQNFLIFARRNITAFQFLE
jgi:hypothetical protein